MPAERTAIIKAKLEQALSPTQVEVIDQSAAHAGHAGAASGAGHFQVTIVSDKFSGQSAVQRHQMVYAALGDLMQSEIHALSIKALTPEEA